MHERTEDIHIHSGTLDLCYRDICGDGFTTYIDHGFKRCFNTCIDCVDTDCSHKHDICRDRFITSTLQPHTWTWLNTNIHSGIKPYGCDISDMVISLFMWRQVYKVYNIQPDASAITCTATSGLIHIHTGVSPYSCDQLWYMWEEFCEVSHDSHINMC